MTPPVVRRRGSCVDRGMSSPLSVPARVPPPRSIPPAAAGALVLVVVLSAGCATSSHELGRIERLPEGTLPPGKEVGPPVNIQPPRPAPPPGYRYRHPGYPYPYRYPPGYGVWGPTGFAVGTHPCGDPVFCGPSGIHGGAWVGPWVAPWGIRGAFSSGGGISLGIRLR